LHYPKQLSQILSPREAAFRVPAWRRIHFIDCGVVAYLFLLGFSVQSFFFFFVLPPFFLFLNYIPRLLLFYFEPRAFEMFFS